LFVVYNGDSSYAAATSPMFNETINHVPTGMTLTGPMGTVFVHQPATFMATLTPSVTGLPLPPSGSVIFKDYGGTLGSTPLSGNCNASDICTASFTTASL